MAHRDFVERRIACNPRCEEQQLEVHHVVYNNRALPFVGVVIPRADNTRRRFEARGQRAGCLHQNILIRRVLGKPVAIAIAAIELEAHVVRFAVQLLALQLLR